MERRWLDILGSLEAYLFDPFLNEFLTSRQFAELYFPYLCTQISQNKRFLLAHERRAGSH